MKQTVIVGAGRIGAAIADMLLESGDYAVAVADRSPARLGALREGRAIATHVLDAAVPGALEDLLEGRFAVLSAMPYHLTARVAAAAATAGVHYLDLTEDVKSTRAVRDIAAHARTAFIPQCGLAPGFIAIAAHALARRFDTLGDLRLRVGALPQHPDNALGYALTWSPEGVINQYCEPCEAIVGGKLCEIAPLEDCEQFVLDGVRYEAFNTSGGIGSFARALEGRVESLSYRTIRYPGHAAIMKLLLTDLHLCERRDLALEILRHALAETAQDMVVVHITATGTRDGRPHAENFSRTILPGFVGGHPRSAIQITTAAGICTALDLLAEGTLPRRGFVAQERIALPDVLANRFGRVFGSSRALTAVA